MVSFSKNLVFSKIKKEFYEAPFKRVFTLDSSNNELQSKSSNYINDDISNRMNLLEESLAELKQTNIEYQLINDFNLKNLTDSIELRVNNLYEINDINLNSLKYQLDEMNENMPKIETGSWELKSAGQNCLSKITSLSDRHSKMHKYSNTIYFKSKFDRKPKVLLSLSNLSKAIHHDFKLNLYADEITKEK